MKCIHVLLMVKLRSFLQSMEKERYLLIQNVILFLKYIITVNRPLKGVPYGEMVLDSRLNTEN